MHVTIIWEYKDTQTQGYTHTMIQYDNIMRIQEYKNTIIQEYRLQ